MKKTILFIILLFLSSNFVFARDYVKLHIHEMKKNQQYEATGKYFENANITDNFKEPSTEKDPKIFKLYKYDLIDETKYNVKIAKDETEYIKYKKYLDKKNLDFVVSQKVKSEDYYKIYRVAERIIRANKLDYINWRIAIVKDTNFNANSSNMNCITINTAVIDTLGDNENALAFVVAHEMAHALCGHSERKEKLKSKMNRFSGLKYTYPNIVGYKVAKARYLKAVREMEYAADTESAILISKAGYSLNNASETISFLNTLPIGVERFSTHPSGMHRLENFNDNRKYFIEDEWNNYGKYNIYNSEVLAVKYSSDRQSVIIERNKNSKDFYSTETMAQVYGRLGYKSYVYGEYAEALKYFNKMFAEDKSNPTAYLYASYSSEALYKKTNNSKYLKMAKDYAKFAKTLDPQNTYINSQIENL